MIHTQYYALMRALTDAIQQASPYVTINQWDFNFNSKTFDSLKLHRNPKPYPKGIVNISSAQKQFVYPLTQNATVGMNAADLVQFPNAFPVASVVNKFEIYALTNRYNINLDISVHFETAAQMLDFYHMYAEYFPGEGKYFYDFKYDYYLWLPPEIIDGFDPTTDEAINIVAEMKDDASSLDLFAKCVAVPLIKTESINFNQDKQSDNHVINFSFSIQDSFVYLLMKVDSKYWLRAKSLNVKIKIQETNGDEENKSNIVDNKEVSGLPDFAQDNHIKDLSDTNNNTDTEKVL